jgi:hypothetical protein
VNPSARLAIVLSSSGALALAGAAAWAVRQRRRRKDPAEVERLRRQDLNRRGRISAGRVLDWIDSEPGKSATCLLVYGYDVAGVTYEVAQDVSALPAIAAAGPQLLGRIASVKYDPRRPTNSIVASEDWCGVALPEPVSPAPAAPPPEEALEET